MAGEERAKPGGPHLMEDSGGLEVGFRLYDAQGLVRDRTLDVEAVYGDLLGFN